MGETDRAGHATPGLRRYITRFMKLEEQTPLVFSACLAAARRRCSATYSTHPDHCFRPTPIKMAPDGGHCGGLTCCLTRRYSGAKQIFRMSAAPWPGRMSADCETGSRKQSARLTAPEPSGRLSFGCLRISVKPPSNRAQITAQIVFKRCNHAIHSVSQICDRTPASAKIKVCPIRST